MSHVIPAERAGSSVEGHAHAGQIPGASGVGSRASIVRGVKGAVRFFAPSLLVGLAAPFLFPAVRRAVRPAAKGLIKGALSLSESIKDGATEAREHLSDLLAEVKAEREAEARESAPASEDRH
jgi:Protein of unknown function (DUF5132)